MLGGSIEMFSAIIALKRNIELRRMTRCDAAPIRDCTIDGGGLGRARMGDSPVWKCFRWFVTCSQLRDTARRTTWTIAWTLVVIGIGNVGHVRSEDRSTEYSAEERGHWSLRPRSRQMAPTLHSMEHARRVRGRADLFVFARLEKNDLPPAPPAGFATFARRMFVDLAGRVPVPGELDEAVETEEPDTAERLVDRLLASPRFGESWGVHWLDVVRYAESEGFEYDRHRPGAWRYRDYVVQSLNADKPFDQFVVEQVAGDELPAPSEDQLVAAGFHRLGPVRRNAGNVEVAFSRNEVLTEMTDAIGSVFLGLTIGCARCHDHKFDPIRQRDYYQLQAFLAATQEQDILLATADEQEQWKAANQQVQDEIKRAREKLEKAQGDDRREWMAKLHALQQRIPDPLPTISSVKSDVECRTPIHLLQRGQPDLPQDLMSPHVLGVLRTEPRDAGAGESIAQRRTLAEWIVSPDHPLTARVLVNRLWQYHFGRGIVATPNDFGVNGAVPTHPELLDELAEDLVAGQWQMKRLHRRMLLSATYRQSSVSAVGGKVEERDPGNSYLSRFARRRLTAEEFRDSMLAITGGLNETLGGASVMLPVKRDLIDLLYEPEQWRVTPGAPQHHRRSIYLVAKRNLRLPFLEVFDQPDLQISCSRRESSTHAPQALEMLNGDFAIAMASDFAGRLQREASTDRAQQVRLAFELVLGRDPSAEERRLSESFLERQSLEEFALAMLNLNALIYVE